MLRHHARHQHGHCRTLSVALPAHEGRCFSLPQVVITCSATMRGAKPVNLKAIADEGCEHARAKGHEVRVGE